MEPGDLLVLTNDTALHGRYPLAPQPAEANADRLQARWNKLLYMMRPEDEPVFEKARWKGRRFIIDKRAFFDFDTIAGTAREMASCQQAGWPDARAGFKRLAVAAACIARGHVSKAEADRQKYGHLHAGEDKR